MAKDRRQGVEAVLIRSFEDFFLDAGISGAAFRLEHHIGRPQYCDMLVLSKGRSLAIECKRVAKKAPLYFSNTFHEDGEGKSQVREMDRFLGASGLDGYLAVEYYPKGEANPDLTVIPWRYVMEAYETEEPAFKMWNAKGEAHLSALTVKRSKSFRNPRLQIYPKIGLIFGWMIL